MERLAPELAPLRNRWGWIALLGVVYFLAGWVALGSVVLATAVSVYIVGFMMILAGVGEVIGAFRLQGWGRTALWIVLGLLYIVGGIMAVRNPLLGAAVLTLVLGWALVASGLTRLIMAFSLRMERSWGLIALSALVTLALGAILLLKWPVSSLFALGIFLGVDLIMAGVGWLSLAFELRGEANRARGATSAAI